jgi:hypothetical protein
VTDNTQKSFWEIFDKDDHAFIIAVIMIGGFLVLLGIPLMKNDTGLTKELAGIFSGWIVAIIAFYFMRNQSYQIGEMAQKEGLKAGTRLASSMDVIYDELDKKYQDTRADLNLITNEYITLRNEYLKLTGASGK